VPAEELDSNGSASVFPTADDRLHFIILLNFFFFKVFVTNFIKSSDPISNVCYISQYLHLDVRHDLVHNIHSIAIYISYYKNVGTAVAMVNVLCYKLEGRLFDPSWYHWIFNWHKILPISLWPSGRLSL